MGSKERVGSTEVLLYGRGHMLKVSWVSVCLRLKLRKHVILDHYGLSKIELGFIEQVRDNQNIESATKKPWLYLSCMMSYLNGSEVYQELWHSSIRTQGWLIFIEMLKCLWVSLASIFKVLSTSNKSVYLKFDFLNFFQRLDIFKSSKDIWTLVKDKWGLGINLGWINNDMARATNAFSMV